MPFRLYCSCMKALSISSMRLTRLGDMRQCLAMLYTYYCKVSIFKSKNLTVEPVRIGLKLDVRRIGELLEVIKSNINPLNPNIPALQWDQQDLQSTLDSLCGKTCELSLISSSQWTQDTHLQSEINDIIGKGYSQLRAIKLHVQECQNTNLTPSSVSKGPQTIEVPSVPSTNVENTTSPNVQIKMCPTSSWNTFVANNQNAPCSYCFWFPSAINVSATEFVPTTTLPDSTYSTAVNESSANNLTH